MIVSGTQPDSPRSGGPLEGEPPLLAAGCFVEPRTDAIADGKASDGLEALRGAHSRPSTWERVEALAAILEPEAFDPDQPALIGWRKRTQAEALAHAAKVLDLGYRLVSVDDDTVERVAAALAAHDGYDWHPDEGAGAYGKWGNSDITRPGRYYLDRACAAVQALRDGSGT